MKVASLFKIRCSSACSSLRALHWVHEVVDVLALCSLLVPKGMALICVFVMLANVRVGVGTRHACKCVVDISMVRLVRRNLLEYFEHVCIFAQTPVSLRNLRSRHGAPRCVQLSPRRAHDVNHVTVSHDCHLFDVANRAVCDAGGQNVHRSEDRRKTELSDEDYGARHRTGRERLHEREKVHPLVLCFFQKRVNPAVVAVHVTKRAEVAMLRRDHSRHAGDALQEDQAKGDRVRRRICGAVAGDFVEHPIHSLEGGVDDSLGECLGLVPRLGGEHLVKLLFRPHMVVRGVHPLSFGDHTLDALRHSQRVRTRRVAEVGAHRALAWKSWSAEGAQAHDCAAARYSIRASGRSQHQGGEAERCSLRSLFPGCP
mmetsp:Transcript_11868/g.29376  ORF Transcript_11868/g.29376 Transcript_11868/m.29376 type:complete len:371 (-) Transcript_11868:11-1123(-)